MADDADALDTEQPETPEIEVEQDGEAEVTLEGEEAPAPEGEAESSVIRDFRAREREKDKRIRELEQQAAGGGPAAPQDPGPKPTLEQFEYDEDKHGAALDKWYSDKAAVEHAKAQQTEQAAQVQRVRQAGYDEAKAAVKIAGLDDAEKRVFAQVDDLTKNALLHAKSPAIIAALDRYPDRLAHILELGRTDPAGMLIALGELKAKAQIMPRRTAPNPEEIAKGTGSIGLGGPDKQLEKLEKEAERTKDRTKVQAYKRSLRENAK